MPFGNISRLFRAWYSVFLVSERCTCAAFGTSGADECTLFPGNTAISLARLVGWCTYLGFDANGTGRHSFCVRLACCWLFLPFPHLEFDLFCVARRDVSSLFAAVFIRLSGRIRAVSHFTLHFFVAFLFITFHAVPCILADQSHISQRHFNSVLWHQSLFLS